MNKNLAMLPNFLFKTYELVNDYMPFIGASIPGTHHTGVNFIHKIIPYDPHRVVTVACPSNQRLEVFSL